MFFNAHVYYALAQNGGQAEPLRIMGALLPDSALTGVVGWETLHDKTTIERFTEYMPAKNSPLGKGLRDHYELDLRSHEQYAGEGGYAFTHQTARLGEVVARACGLESTERAMGLAHNFIESGVDIHLLRQNPSVQQTVQAALQAVDLGAVAKNLADFLHTDTADTHSKLARFTELVTTYDLRELDGWVDLWAEITLLLLGNQLDRQAAKEALTLAVELTADDYQHVITP